MDDFKEEKIENEVSAREDNFEEGKEFGIEMSGKEDS